MFVPSRMGPGLGPNGQPVQNNGLCICGCHGHGQHPPAVEARMCRECAEERFRSWESLVDVLMRG